MSEDWRLDDALRMCLKARAAKQEASRRRLVLQAARKLIGWLGYHRLVDEEPPACGARVGPAGGELDEDDDE